MLLLYILLGVITGVAAAGFVRGLHLLEDWFDLIPGNYVRHMLGMLLVGLLITACAALSPSYWFFVACFALARPLLASTATVVQVVTVG